MTDKNRLPAPEKKRFTIFGVEVAYLYLFGIVVAFCAWVIENIACLVLVGEIDCRSHLLPFISPYALIVFAFHIVFGDPDDITLFGKRIFKKSGTREKLLSNLLAFLMIAACVFLGELVVGDGYELLFGVSLWDHRSMPLAITKHTSVISTLGFGIAAYALFRFVYKPFLAFLRKKVPYKVAKWITLTLGVAIVLDTLFLIFQIAVFGKAPVYWSLKLR